MTTIPDLDLVRYRPIDPRVCSALSAEDARILDDRERDELRRLLDACLVWEDLEEAHLQGESSVLSERDRALLDAVAHARDVLGVDRHHGGR